MLLLKSIWLLAICSFALSLETGQSEPAFSGDAIRYSKLTKPLRVLAFLPFNGYSHFIMFKALMLGLAKRGHNVTVVSPFPLKSPVENYTDVDLSDRFPSLNSQKTFEGQVAGDNANVYSKLMRIVQLSGPQLCKDAFTHPKVKSLLLHKGEFDVVFTEVFGTDCFSAVGYILQAPVINLVTANTILWMHDYIGEPTHPAIVPNHFLRTGRLETLWTRVQNTMYSVITRLLYYILLTRPSEAVIRETLGEHIPPLSELRHNVSLVMVNTVPTIFGVKPTVPRILPVAGIHVQPPDARKVSEDIRHWLDTAPDGVMYFSLGSLINGDSLPESLRRAFIEAFAEIKPIRVLWKFKEHGNITGLPDNVKLAGWLPQVEILSHPNVAAFMTHAGLMGVIEAVYYGVPMVSIPVFADQLHNTDAVVKLGCAVYLDHNTLTKEDIVKAVLKVTTDESIRRRTKEVSELFRDRPMSPLDSAIWWTEYVVRHDGAPHLESATARMPFWRYALLDVFGALLIALLLPLYVIYYVIACLRKRRNAVESSTKITQNKKRS